LLVNISWVWNADLFDKEGHANLYAALNVEKNEIHILKEKDLENDGSTLEMYRYANTNLKIFGKTQKEGLCTSGIYIVEFKLDSCSASPDDVAYYSKSQTKTFE